MRDRDETVYVDEALKKDLQTEVGRRISANPREFPLDEIISVARRRRSYHLVLRGVASIVVLLAVMMAFSTLRSIAGSDRDSAETTAQPKAQGQLIIQVGERVMAFSTKGEGRVLHEGAAVWAANSDGSYLTSDRGEQGELVGLDLHRAGVVTPVGMPSGGLQYAVLSPDGEQVAFILDEVTDGDDPPIRRLCVSDVSAGHRCFDLEISPWLLDWSPDSVSLVVTGDEGEDVLLVDAASGTSRRLFGVADGRIVGLEGGTDLQFYNPKWSSSGQFISFFAGWPAASKAPAYSMVPVVVDASGTIVTHGKVRPNYSGHAWAPDRDVVAYSTVTTEDGRLEVFLLDASSRMSSELLSSTTIPSSDFAERLVSLEWDPDGDFLAVAAGDGVSVVNTRGSDVNSEFRLTNHGSLAGWID